MNYKLTCEGLVSQIDELKKENKALLDSILLQNESIDDENQEFINSILNNMGDSVFVKDSQSRLILVNDSFCKIFGLSRKDILGKTLAEDVTEEERETFLRIDKQVLSDGLENINEESLTVRGGQKLIISTRKSRFIDINDNKFLVGVIRDITERKKAEEALVESETKFRELNTTKDKLLSIIGHDLRSPLSNITVLSEIVLKSLERSDFSKAEECLLMINSSAKSGVTLLENLLSWAQSQTGKLNYCIKKLSLNNIVAEVVKQSDAVARRKKISLEVNLLKEICFETDERMLKTVLRNLISNAIKFTKSGGKVSVLVKEKGDFIEISVLDNGVGISEEVREKLFHIPTELSHSSLGTANEKGTGFGLILCKEFIEKLNGEICVESEEGKGSKFKITLPYKT